MSDLSYSASLVESKAVGEAGAGDGPKIHDDVTDSANTHTGTDAVDKNNSTSRSDDSSDPATAKNYSPPQIPITSDLTPSEVDQEESQEEPEFSTSSQPPNSQQLDMFKQQLQHFESRDQQLLHLVGRNNRELLRQQDEQQHHLEETLTTQQQALAELRAGFRSQQHGSRVYVCKIAAIAIPRLVGGWALFLSELSIHPRYGVSPCARINVRHRYSQPVKVNW